MVKPKAPKPTRPDAPKGKGNGRRPKVYVKLERGIAGSVILVSLMFYVEYWYYFPPGIEYIPATPRSGCY